MEQLLKAFLAETARRIDSLKSDLEMLRVLQKEGFGKLRILRQMFRQIHTIKGSSAAFDLKNSVRLAHEIEEILEELRAGRKKTNETGIQILEEGIHYLENIFISIEKNQVTEVPAQLIEKWNRWKNEKDLSLKSEEFENFQNQLPEEVSAKLNIHEKKYLNEVLRDGARLFMVNAAFSFDNFGEDFKNLRNKIRKVGEVIANLPSAKVVTNGVGLCLLCASDLEKNEILNLFAPLSEDISIDWCDAGWNEFENSGRQIKDEPQASPISIDSIFKQTVITGKKTAQSLEKSVEFITSGNDKKVSGKHAEAVSIALLHLVRNAVDHGIESSATRRQSGKSETGLVRIEVSENENFQVIKISDDGKGISPDEIKDVAVLRGWAQNADEISDSEAWEMLFKPNFSMSTTLSHVSGRGFGLDIVENIIKEIGGEIRLESIIGKGTNFEIIVPFGK